MPRANASILDELHGMLAQEFIDRIKNGKATSGDLSAAVRLLKDNGIEARSTEAAEVEDRLAGLLPFQPPADNEDIVD